MTNEPPNFWNFSLGLYDREGVAAACLQLQSNYNLDVNLVLFCYWHGSQYGEINEQLLADAIDFSESWRQHVVQPLRDTRSWMKFQAARSSQSDDLRERIKADELAAEKYQQERIYEFAMQSSKEKIGMRGSAASSNNVDKLLQMMGIERDKMIEDCLQIISRALLQ